MNFPQLNQSLTKTNFSSHSDTDTIWTVFFDVMVISILTVICISGLCGNFIVAAIILTRKKMHTATNWFVFNLAVSHILIIFITIPLWIILPKINWPFGRLSCKIFIMPVMEHFAGVSVLTHTGVGVVRHVIVKNSKTGHKISNVYVRLTIGMIWLVAFLFLTFPLMGLLGFFIIEFNPWSQHYVCQLHWYTDLSRYVYRVSTFILTYVVPMVMTGFSYMKIHHFVRENLLSLNAHLSANRVSVRQQKMKQMNKMLTVMYAMFAFTTLPLQLFFFIYDFYDFLTTTSTNVIVNVLFVLFYSQVVVNPVVLFYMGENFRREMYKSFVCYCCFKSKCLRLVSKTREGFHEIGDQGDKQSTERTLLEKTPGTSGKMDPRVHKEFEQEKDNSNRQNGQIGKGFRANGKIGKETHRNGQNGKEFHGNGKITGKEFRPNGKMTGKEFRENGRISKEVRANGDIVSKDTTNKTLSDNLAEVLKKNTSDLTAYYDDGTLMCLYNKQVGVVSLAHDDGRETAI